MAWVAPTTFAVGDTLGAAAMNIISGDLTFLHDVQWTVGDMKVSAQPADHGDWLIADATNISRTTYATLYNFAVAQAIIGAGKLFGVGDGSTTFAKPDPLGRGLVIKGSNTDVDVMGDSDGVAVANRSPKHNHTVTQPTISAPAINVGQPTITKPNVTINDPGHVHNVIEDLADVASGSGSSRFRYDVATRATNPATTGITALLASTPTASGGTAALANAPVATNGAVGPGGTLPVDTPAYLVIGNLFVHS